MCLRTLIRCLMRIICPNNVYNYIYLLVFPRGCLDLFKNYFVTNCCNLYFSLNPFIISGKYCNASFSNTSTAITLRPCFMAPPTCHFYWLQFIIVTLTIAKKKNQFIYSMMSILPIFKLKGIKKKSIIYNQLNYIYPNRGETDGWWTDHSCCIKSKIACLH